jgi:16S rRNA (cytosine967-C5)-methyltransferase
VVITLNNPFVDPYMVLTQVYSGGAYLKEAFKAVPIEPANKARTVKICYGVLEKDVYLSYIIEQNTQKKPKAAIRLVLKIALYLLEYLQKHDYMVVDYAVELTKKLGKEGAAGFVNAFLRSYTLSPLPTKATEKLAVEASVPLWLAERVRRSYKGEALAILSEPSHGVCVRFERGEEAYLQAPHEQTPFQGVYFFPNFVRDEGFGFGDYTFQSVGSVAICQIVKSCQTLLDACAAPGGKSVLLAKKCNQVTACELHPHRVALIESYKQRMGATNITAVQADSTVYDPPWEGAFEGVLCDVPCSGTGVLNENPDIKLFRKESDIASLNQTQLAILNNCARYVKSGGTLYYSTCSILPEENDSVVYTFLQSHPEFTLQIPTSPLPAKTTKFGLQFLPHISQGAGFFITTFQKA